jgi:hypothetical protein
MIHGVAIQKPNQLKEHLLCTACEQQIGKLATSPPSPEVRQQRPPTRVADDPPRRAVMSGIEADDPPRRAVMSGIEADDPPSRARDERNRGG